jgi:hypothetical protein
MQDNAANLAKALGYASYHEFKNSTGLDIPYTGRGAMFINNIDPFYRAYASSSTVNYDKYPEDTDPFLVASNLKIAKARIAAKVRQRRDLEQIRNKAIETIKDYLSKTYDFERELILREDIVFAAHSHFKVGGAVFNFYGTITDKSFNIYQSTHASHRAAYTHVLEMQKFINFKQSSHAA